mgnify:CR=1 FL=1
MTYLTTANTSQSHAGSNLNPRLTARPARLAKIINTLVVWQNRSVQRDHLRTIDDRLLADMGISRADAERESRKPFWRA